MWTLSTFLPAHGSDSTPDTQNNPEIQFPGCEPRANINIDGYGDSRSVDGYLDHDNSEINGGCFIVGFVARLSGEKNPGLFFANCRRPVESV